MKIDTKQLKKWIKALDSGLYKQTFGALNNKDGYCCLGVACDVLIPKHLIERNEYGFISYGMPESQYHAPQWLGEINLDFKRKAGQSLANLNDSKKFNFSEIATLLELVYIHKILD